MPLRRSRRRSSTCTWTDRSARRRRWSWPALSAWRSTSMRRAGAWSGRSAATSQAQLLQYFDLPIALLQTGEALSASPPSSSTTWSRDGVRYAEVRWAPRLHLERGLSVTGGPGGGGGRDRAGVIGARQRRAAGRPDRDRHALRTRRRRTSSWRARRPRSEPRSSGSTSPGRRPNGRRRPTRPPSTRPARAASRLTAHAGEVPGPQRVREVLDFGISRVAHGVTAVDDDALLQLLRARDITLDLCPTSNVQAGIVADLSSHPIAALHRAGVKRDPLDRRPHRDRDLALRGDGEDRDAVGLTNDELAAIALNAFARAFAPAGGRGADPRPERRGRGTPGATGPASAETSLEQGKHRGRVRGDRVGASLAVERGRQRRVRHAGQHQDRGASRAVRSRRCRHRGCRRRRPPPRPARARPRGSPRTWPARACRSPPASTPVAVARAATIEPAPGRKPTAVGYRVSALVAMSRAPSMTARIATARRP